MKRLLPSLLVGWMLLGMAAQATVPESVQEDHPAWRCHTMGNHLCR